MGYSPILGRFLQRDPVGYLGGASLYEVAKSNPNRHTDPYGNTPNDCTLVAGGTAYDPKGWTYVMEWIGTQKIGSTKEAGIELSVVTVMAVFVRKYRKLYQCCDCTDSIYWRWGEAAGQLGTNESSGSEGDGTVLAVGTAGSSIKVPSPWPGVKIPIPFLSTSFKPWGFTAPNWTGYKRVGPTPVATSPADSPPQDNPSAPQGFRAVPAAQLNCAGSMTPLRPAPDPAKF